MNNEDVDKSIVNTIGKNIKNIRKTKKIKFSDLSKNCGCSINYIGEIERGKKNITIDTVFKLSRALSISPVSLFINTGNDKNNLVILEILEKLLTSDEKTIEFVNKVMIAALDFTDKNII